jgi:hypothetical protein
MYRLLIILCLLFGAYQLFSDRSITQPPGQLAPEAPLQQRVSGVPAFEHRGYQITPLARFAATARVLSRENYHLGREADLSPVDLALGWGPMSDQTVVDRIRIRQSGRFYYWRVDQFPIPRRDIERNSANMHFIPADDSLAKRISKVPEGALVRLEGMLVNVDASDGWYWRSSLTRDDTGGGACELVWLTVFEIAQQL